MDSRLSSTILTRLFPRSSSNLPVLMRLYIGALAFAKVINEVADAHIEAYDAGDERLRKEQAA